MGKKHRGKKIIASNIRDQRVDRDSKKKILLKKQKFRKKKFLIYVWKEQDG